MPFDVKTFGEMVVELPIDFFDEEIILKYSPALVGDPDERDRRARRYAEAREAILAKVEPEDAPDRDIDAEIARQDGRLTWSEVDRPLVEFACSMLVGWNIEEDGEPLPVTPDDWERWKFPPSLARRIITEVQADVASLGANSRARRS